MPDWLSDAWYDFNYSAIWVAFQFGWSYRSVGWHNVPQRQPVLVVANHQSFIDPLLVGLAVRRRFTYLARKTLFHNPIFGGYLRSVRCVPVDQEGVAKEGLKATIEKLKEGNAVLIFPEGNRTPDGRMQPLRPGVQLLIKRGMCPVLPVGLAGAFESFPRSAKFPTLSPIFMPPNGAGVAAVVGKPIDPKRLADLPRAELLEVLYHEIDRLQKQAEALRRKSV
jgi:1-acyl-sn-glycerol-3-phosphate acyltransferase